VKSTIEQRNVRLTIKRGRRELNYKIQKKTDFRKFEYHVGIFCRRKKGVGGNLRLFFVDEMGHFQYFFC